MLHKTARLDRGRADKKPMTLAVIGIASEIGVKPHFVILVNVEECVALFAGVSSFHLFHYAVAVLAVGAFVIIGGAFDFHGISSFPFLYLNYSTDFLICQEEILRFL